MEDLLFTEYYIFEHLTTGSKNIACDEYHIPERIRKHVDYITPGIRLRADPAKLRRLKRTQQSSDLQRRSIRPDYVEKSALLPPDLPPLNLTVCDRYVTPECIRGELSHQDNQSTP